jgi:hypothetical protein
MDPQGKRKNEKMILFHNLKSNNLKQLQNQK